MESKNKKKIHDFHEFHINNTKERAFLMMKRTNKIDVFQFFDENRHFKEVNVVDFIFNQNHVMK